MDVRIAAAPGRRHAGWRQLLVLITLVAAAVACEADGGGDLTEAPGAPADGSAEEVTEDDAADDPAETDAAGETGAAATLTIVDFAFDPATLEVDAGATIAVRNEDGATHTVTAEDGSFDLRLDGGADGTVTVDAAGTYAFACALHPSMVGQLVVG
jgi:plastocyanin